MRTWARVAGFLLVSWLAGVASLPVCAADSAAADSLAGILEECRVLRLAPQGRHVHDVSVTYGHMQISFADGTLVPVLGQSGSVLGAYFEGRGGYLYTTEDGADRAAMELNVSRVAKNLRAVAGRLADDFRSVLILTSDPRLVPADATDTEGEPALAQPLVAGFEKDLLNQRNTSPEFDFRTATSRLNGLGSWTWVEMGGGLERVGYLRDDVLDGREYLVNFRKLGNYVTRFVEILSVQSLPAWNQERRLAVVLTKADLAVATDDNRSGTIDSDMTFHVKKAGTRVLPLMLINNRDSEKPEWSSSRQQLTLDHVLGDGGAVPFAHRYNEVVVEIPDTTVDDTDVRLRFATHGEIFLDMDRQHADSYFSLGSGWYPAPQGWATQRFTYTLKVRTKKPWRPVTSGTEVSLKDEGPYFVADSRADYPSTLITVLAGKYVTHGETVDGVTIRIHAYAMARKNVIDNMPKLAAAIVTFYTSILGPMPAAELDIVEVPEYGFGISPSGVILLTTEAYKPHQDELANFLVRGINARLAHEIAHQWFAHKAIPDDVSDAWLSESFAEYFSGLAMGALAATDKTIVGFSRMLAEWQGDDPHCAVGAPIITAGYLGGRQGYQDRRCLLYSRGPLVLHMLRTSIGNERFMAATKKFLDTANVGAVTTDDYAKAVSDVVKMDMGWYFDQWVRRSGNAQVDVQQHVDPAAGGQYRLWGTITQTPGAGFKKLLVPLVWETGGKTEARVVFADQPEKTFEFMLPAKPGSIKPDPFENNLAVYR